LYWKGATIGFNATIVYLILYNSILARSLNKQETEQ
jgi:hypothetical protein